VAGSQLDLERTLRELEPLAVRERAGDLHGRAPAAKRTRDRPQRDHELLGDPVADHQLAGELILALGIGVVALQERRDDIDRSHLGPRARSDDVDEAEVVDVLVGDDNEVEVVDGMPEVAELVLELVERLARVGPGVD
jgi:hypothetical protein